MVRVMPTTTGLTNDTASPRQLVRDQWRAPEVTPGTWMVVGMNSKRQIGFNRVLEKVLADGMSDYERAIFGQ
jgi:hypothetical protein